MRKLLIVVLIMGFCVAVGQTRVSWSKDVRLIGAYLDTNSVSAAQDLLEVCDQTQIDRLEAKWFPDRSSEEKRQGLDRMRLFIQELNLERSTTQEYQDLMTAVDKAIAAAESGRTVETGSAEAEPIARE